MWRICSRPTRSGGRRTDPTPYHVLVAEVMECGLSVEPQVAVTLHQVRHLRDGGFLVPERIALSLCLFDPAREYDPAVRQSSNGGDEDRQWLGTVFSLTRASAENAQFTETGHIALPGLRLPDSLLANGQLNIMTEITTFGALGLKPYDSGLTHPLAVDIMGPLAPADQLTLSYRLSSDPGLEVHVKTGGAT